MAKISRYGGPSSTDAQPGDVIEDGLGRLSALHPEEQNALPLHGEPDDNAWLKRDDEAPDGVARNDDGEPVRGKQGERVEHDDDREGEDVSPGDNSSRSDTKRANLLGKNDSDDLKPANTTESPSSSDAKPEPFTADSAGKSSTSKARK